MDNANPTGNRSQRKGEVLRGLSLKTDAFVRSVARGRPGRIGAHSAKPSACGQAGSRLADEITFQNDAVDPSLEFRKQHNHFFVAQTAERLDRDRAEGEWRPSA